MTMRESERETLTNAAFTTLEYLDKALARIRELEAENELLKVSVQNRELVIRSMQGTARKAYTVSSQSNCRIRELERCLGEYSCVECGETNNDSPTEVGCTSPGHIEASEVLQGGEQ